MTTEMPMRNVGTNGSPVSRLHERTVATLYDHLTLRRTPTHLLTLLGPFGLDEKETTLRYSEVRARLTPGGDLSHNLLEGVSSVHIPGEWDSVGGVVPGLILCDGDSNPVRVIDVIVTSPPPDDKRQKLDRLVEGGVDVVEVVVRTRRDLLDLCWIPSRPSFYAGVAYRGCERADEAMLAFMENLVRCSPEVPRRFLELCQAMTSTDSIQPVHPGNPLRDKLTGSEAEGSSLSSHPVKDWL